MDISYTVIDRTHRICPEYSDYKTKTKCKAIYYYQIYNFQA